MEEAADDALSGAEPGADRLRRLLLPVLLAKDILMEPGLPVCNRLPPRSISNKVGQFHNLTSSC